MGNFFRESLPIFVSILIMAVWGFVDSFRSIKSDIKEMNELRKQKNISEMSGDEKQIIQKVLRSSVIKTSIGALAAGVSATVVGYFI